MRMSQASPPSPASSLKIAPQILKSVRAEGTDAANTIKTARGSLAIWSLSARIIVASIRTAMQLQSGAWAGEPSITSPPQFLPKMVDHQYTRETVRQFVQDVEKTLSEM